MFSIDDNGFLVIDSTLSVEDIEALKQHGANMFDKGYEEGYQDGMTDFKAMEENETTTDI